MCGNCAPMRVPILWDSRAVPWLLLFSTLTCADPSFDPGARAVVQVLDEDAVQGSRWAWGWGVTLGSNIAAQLTLAALVDDYGFRVDRFVGASSSTIGLLAVIISRPKAMSVRRELGACPTREAVNAAILKVSHEERFAQAWYQHVLGAAFNVGVGLYLGLAYDHWRTGVLQGVVGTGVSELMIRTRPNRMTRFSIAPLSDGGGLRPSAGLSLSASF